MDYYEIGARGARFVEVIGDGPYTDKAGGVVVEDGQTLTASCDLKTDFIRKFRADAPSSVTDAHVAFDPPITIRLSVRRCVRSCWWWIARVWAWLGGSGGNVKAKPVASASANDGCTWNDLKPDPPANAATVRGGDVVIANFQCFGSGDCP